MARRRWSTVNGKMKTMMNSAERYVFKRVLLLRRASLSCEALFSLFTSLSQSLTKSLNFALKKSPLPILWSKCSLYRPRGSLFGFASLLSGCQPEVQLKQWAICLFSSQNGKGFETLWALSVIGYTLSKRSEMVPCHEWNDERWRWWWTVDPPIILCHVSSTFCFSFLTFFLFFLLFLFFSFLYSFFSFSSPLLSLISLFPSFFSSSLSHFLLFLFFFS